MNCLFKFVRKFLVLSLLIVIGLQFSLVSKANASSKSSVSSSEFFRSGVEQLQRGNYQQAVVELTNAIEIKKDYAGAYSNRCLAYLQLEDYQNAVTDCNQSINLAPENIESYINRGIAYYRLGNFIAAIDDNNSVLRRKPQDFRAYYNRGIATAALKNYNDAILDYHRALSLVPETPSYLSADIYNDLGLAKFYLHDLHSATNYFTLAIRLNPKSELAYFNRGCTCGKNGDNLGAVHDFSNVVRLNPSNAQAYVNRGIAYHNLGYEQAGLSDLRTAAAFFRRQGQEIAYQKTLDLIKTVQRQIPTIEEIV
ncbi:MAG: tetratricopeptide repeat protein [Calothrix sp. C42_A2020_038]|nr:tetratricopeptide repeat protein [Calothrix sp. C42_A2020_038]